ncbi:hypothetical protein CROQUDRAFT_667832 [Cronartium quercuum f. sp. fusiforme G11]|uniref:Uncharacterized protein n=1 Tax=Cronartium quercuum f. sp. fusiforme G11 TaxID=708437 RepID=A0A9P6NT84_9BASI|nr:hypothetical protein CROQUDRAFT_667832 [Cronartium quercuum f. sp. fusiforme G11]
MQWGVIAGGMAACYAELPADHPLSTRKSKYAILNSASTLPPHPNATHTAIHIPADPSAMQIDAIHAREPKRSDLWGAVKCICWAQRRCFSCLEVLDSKHGTPSNSNPCPNKEATIDQRLKFLKDNKSKMITHLAPIELDITDDEPLLTNALLIEQAEELSKMT